MNRIRERRSLSVVWQAVLCSAALIALSQCEDSTAPAPPGSIAILSGNNQYSLRGTELPDPLVVVVKTDDGSVPAEATVEFRVVGGEGTLSRGSAGVNKRGQASTRLTLGQALGTVRVEATVADKSVVFTATSANYYCPEADDTLRVCGTCPQSYGASRELFLVTQKSGLYSPLSGAIVAVDPFDTTAFGFAEIPATGGGVFPPVIWDAAFSSRGDFYVSLAQPIPQLVKVSLSGGLSHFASLTERSEIASNPYGLLVGCDSRGPFVVGCRDTLLRYSEATFPGNPGPVNDDALAVDPRRHSSNPLGEDVYFIHTTDRTLYRLPLDSLRVEPQGLQIVTPDLTPDEARWARGMACDDRDGTIFILVQSNDTREILQVTTAGVKTVLVDFFSRRGPGDAAGIQDDLALDRPFLHTLDTFNDKHVLYNYLTDDFFVLFSDSLEQAALSRRDANGNLVGGERVGLAVLK